MFLDVTFCHLCFFQNGSSPSAVLSACSELERVVRDFIETARMYGRIIISELHLPPELRTIRPLNVGGVLGGAKFMVSKKVYV